MEMFQKLIVVALLLIIILRNASLARLEKKMENQKSTYIVLVRKSQMQASFDDHFVWYESILKSISDSAKMTYTYDNAIHGFSTRLTNEEAQSLKNRIEILKVLPHKKYELHTTRTPQFLGLDKITGKFFNSNEGNDVIIGVIDSGIWPESKSFDDTGLGPIPSGWKGECEIGTNFTTSHCNKKIIGARFFLKGYESELGPIDESKLIRSPRDSEGHGTHTASTLAGSLVKGASLLGSAFGTARGMATGARIAVYKVCWNGSCFDDDILAAIDKAIFDNVDILSMSLGGGASNYDQDVLAIGTFSAMEKGIIVSCAAGNSGPNYSTVQNIAPWITTVGAGTIDRDFPAYLSLGNGQNYSGVSFYSGKDLPNSLIPFIYAGNASKGVINGKCAKDSLDPKKVAGKIVLCDRGDFPRIKKGAEVESAGGLGMVLANGAEDGEKLTADLHLLPAIPVGFESGEAIKKYLFSDPNPMATIVFPGTKVRIEPSPVVADFSSRGPNPITAQILKPDIIAPGVNILAAWTKRASPTSLDLDQRRVDFNIISGTSMACPHVSGLAALIKSAHPDWSPAAIRSALMTTAYMTYQNGVNLLDSADNKTSTPFAFGAGHVNPISALNPGLVYDLAVDDYLNFLCALNYTSDQIETVVRRKYQCDTSKIYSVTDLNYPSFAVVFEPAMGGYGAKEAKYMRTLTNVGAVGMYKAYVTTDIPSIKVLVEPDVLSFNENEKKSYTITFTASGPKPLNPHGFGRLEWSNGRNVVRSPLSFSWK